MPEKNIYASGVYILANDLLPWPEGKICADWSLKVPEFNEGDGSVGIADVRTATHKNIFLFRSGCLWFWRIQKDDYDDRDRRKNDNASAPERPVYFAGFLRVVRIVFASFLS